LCVEPIFHALQFQQMGFCRKLPGGTGIGHYRPKKLSDALHSYLYPVTDLYPRGRHRLQQIQRIASESGTNLIPSTVYRQEDETQGDTSVCKRNCRTNSTQTGDSDDDEIPALQ
jgi:hypothetical protein